MAPPIPFIWLTDVHLSHVSPKHRADFAQRAARAAAGRPLLVTGDIGESDTFADHLGVLHEAAGAEVYFVLGNHDYYGATITSTRAAAAECPEGIVYLPLAGVIPFDRYTALVGVDGFGDARYGDPMGSQVMLSDWFMIDDLSPLRDDRRALIERLHAIGDEEALRLRPTLESAATMFDHVYIATHVPPWKDACWHGGTISDNEWLPWFTCRAVGDVIDDVARRHRDTAFTVVCGHTHGNGQTRIADNVMCHTGGASYGTPEVQPILGASTNRL